MRRNQSILEDFVEIMSRLPWWVNIILAFISYSVLHQLAMSFYDPAPKIDVGTMGDYAVSKMPSVFALFGQFVIPFALILSGLIGLIKKYKRTGQYRELLFYIFIIVLFFGQIASKDGGVHNSMKKRVANPTAKENVMQPPRDKIEENQSSEAENEVKALQGILDGINGKKTTEKEEAKVYSWINEKGQKVYSNIPPPR